jgi:NRPS condensation-like uncharacterized protein
MERAKTTAPLNCIGKALLALHSKEEPMTLHWILTIDGAVDPARLNFALLAVLFRRRSPKSSIQAAPFGLVRESQDAYNSEILSVWDLAGPEAPDEDQRRTGARRERRLSEWMNKPLDPAKALPCRVLLLRETLRESSLVFTFHHAAVDGVRALRFVGEVIQEYNGVDGRSRLSAQGAPATDGDQLVALAKACRPGVKHFYLKMAASLAHRFLIAPVSPNARIYRTTSKPSAEICFCQDYLNPRELRQIRSKSKSVGVKVNDILLAACFRTIEQWNEGYGKPSRKISIMVPVDVGSAVSSPTMANQVSFISVPTTQKERSDPEELICRVGRRTSDMLRNGIAFSMVYAAYFCTRLPLGIPKTVARLVMATRIYLDTVLLTNLGLIWPKEATSMEGVKIGSAKIASVVVIPPVASPMGISLSAGTYNDCLYVALAYKTSHFSEVQAERFLGLYLREIRSYQGTPEAVPVPEPIHRDTRGPVPA